MSDKEDLIDSPLNEHPEIDIMAQIQWWEKMRILYSILLISSEYMMIHGIPYGVSRHGISIIILVSIAFTICANICYTISFGLTLVKPEILYLSKSTKNLRLLIFIFLLLFSLFTTIFLFDHWLTVDEI